MNVALLFFLLLVPLSGFIAWAGDRIGHKSGKKRHTLFGLRPRHTATLITIAAGMCISVVSFGIMWTLSGTFREVMARGAELLQENKSLSQENQSVLKQVDEKRRAISKLDADVQDYQNMAKKADVEKRNAESDFLKAKQSLASAKKAMQAASMVLSQTRSKLGATQKSLSSAEQQVADARSQVARAHTDFQRAEAHTRKAQAEARNAEAQVKLAQATTLEVQKNAQSDFDAARKYQNGKLYQQKAELEKSNNLLATQKEQIDNQTAQLDEQRSDLAKLTREREQRLRDVKIASEAIEKFRTTTTALRGRQITYKVGEEVDRVSIPAGISIWRIEAIVESLLTSAAKKAEARGAKRLTDTARAVALLPQAAMVSAASSGASGAPDAPRSLNPISDSGNSGTGAVAPILPAISETDLISAAANAIRRENKDVVVVVVTSANAVSGEPVSVDLRTFHNPVVLTSGTTVGEITVDGSASRQEIIDALYGFLRRDVRRNLLKAGVIPPLVGSDPNNTNPNQLVSETEAGNIFTLSGDAWLKIMDDIRKAGSQAQVIVRVDKTTHAAEPVSLRFDVKKGRDSRPVPLRNENGGKGISGSPAGMAAW